MEQIRNKELELLLEKAEELDWSYTIYQEPEGTYNGWYCNERNYVELEKYSPAGEDFSMIIDFNMDNPIDSFMEDLKEYSEDFDVDEHVEMWLPSRGKGGCPESISELVKDAEAIRDMIVELWEILDSQHMEGFKWQHIQFADGSNPYICKAEKDFKWMQKHYNLEKIEDGFWIAR